MRLNAANLFIEGDNLTATKARLLLTAAIMKLGGLPHARDPEHPTSQELAIRKRIEAFHQIFKLTEPVGRTRSPSCDDHLVGIVPVGDYAPMYSAPTIQVVLNWFDELKHRVPTQ